ncbi:MAG: hypothetical protein AMXMBFR47_22650 [Planctomycetota bacterium]
MTPVVTLATQNVRAANGKRYRYYQLRWFGVDGKRYSQSIGRTEKLSRRQAEKLRQAKELELRQKPGLCSPGRIPTLAGFLETYIESRRSELAPGSLELHERTAKYLRAFFGDDRRLDQITRYDAREFKTALAKGEIAKLNQRVFKNISPQTVDQHIRNARTMFNRAVDDDLIMYNPFDRLAGGVPPVEKNWHYVTIDELDKLLAACPNQAWRTLLGLCRLAGLRQGEALSLRWSDVDWNKGRFTVWAQKTKRRRIVPIAPELMPILRDALQHASVGEPLVISGIVAQNVWRDFGVIRKRASVPKYAKWCHTLRKNREGDWMAAGFPFHVVVEWMGHSEEVARQHYLRVNDADLDAATRTAIAGELTQKLTQIESEPRLEALEDEPQTLKLEDFMKKAGEGIRTLDVQLGKLAFYH